MLLIPPNLLPRPVVQSRSLHSFRREVRREGVACIQTEVIAKKICCRRTKKKLEGPSDKIVCHAIVNINPQAPLFRKPCLIEIPKPELLPLVNVFFGCLCCHLVATGKKYDPEIDCACAP